MASRPPRPQTLPRPGHRQVHEGRVVTYFDKPLGDDITGVHRAFLATKFTKTGQRRFYIRIIHDDEPSFVSQYCAVGNNFYRLFSSYNPKGRVIRSDEIDPQTKERQTIGYISRQIPGFRPISQIPNEILRAHMSTPSGRLKKQLADLFVAAYIGAENDLHNGNWGLDDSANIVKIDNDQTFFAHTARYKEQHTASDNPLRLAKWPASIYPRDYAFPITLSDLERLPILNHAQPSNWPASNQGPDMKGYCQQLSQDKVFQKLKWRAMTRFLLTDDTQLEDIVKADTTLLPDAAKLSEFLIHRKSELKRKLLLCPQYREYLTSMRESEFNAIREEFIEYNARHCKKLADGTRDDEVKPNSIHRVYSPDVMEKLQELRLSAQNPPADHKAAYWEEVKNDMALTIAREKQVLHNIDNNRFKNLKDTEHWVHNRLKRYQSDGKNPQQALQKLSSEISHYLQYRIPSHDAIMNNSTVNLQQVIGEIHDAHLNFLDRTKKEHEAKFTVLTKCHHALSVEHLKEKIDITSEPEKKAALQTQLTALSESYSHESYLGAIDSELPMLKTAVTAPVAESEAGILAARRRAGLEPAPPPIFQILRDGAEKSQKIEPGPAKSRDLVEPTESDPFGFLYSTDGKTPEPAEASKQEGIEKGEKPNPTGTPPKKHL